jgi:two-component system LytT family sensor kinase
MQILKRSKQSIQRELICWTLLVLFLIGYNHTEGSRLAYYTYVVLYTANFLWCYYALYLIIFPNFFETKKLYFVLSCVMVISIWIFFDYIHVKKISPALGGRNFRQKFGLFHYIIRAFIPFTFVAVAATTSYLNWRSVNILKEKSKKGKELLLRELSYYKAQFNSHFTLNFFNFCYNKTLYSNSEAAKDVEKFSEMLLFSLKNDSNEYVAIVDEIKYIKNFISIQKCITNKVFIDLEYNCSLEDFYILPGILSTLVENSFKHGVFNDESNPIKISLSIQDDILTAIIRNKKANKKAMNTTGIGINALVQILKTFYPNKHSYRINENEYEYCSEINLELISIG